MPHDPDERTERNLHVVATIGSRVRAAINYVRNPPAPGAQPLTFVTGAEDRSTMETTPGREVWINDIRGTETSLEHEGFVLTRSDPGGPGRRPAVRREDDQTPESQSAQAACRLVRSPYHRI
jgi:hypothetical protein